MYQRRFKNTKRHIKGMVIIVMLCVLIRPVVAQDNVLMSDSIDLPSKKVINVEFDSTAYTYAQTITEKDLSMHLHILASDDFEGREMGEKGQKLAATYMSKYFQRWELKPVGDEKTYFQKFKMLQKKIKNIEINVAVKGESIAFEEWVDFAMLKRDFVKMDQQLPLKVLDISEVASIKQNQVQGFAILLLEQADPDLDGPTKKVAIQRLYDLGAAMLFNIYTQQTEMTVGSSYRHYLNKGQLFFINEKIELDYPIISITERMAARLFSIKEDKMEKVMSKISLEDDKWKKAFKEAEVTIKIKVEERLLHTENVCGLIEGGSKKDEIIVLSAHYDHLGIKGDSTVFNGADDDGSGTVAIMEMAQAFAQAKKEGKGPDRSILIIGMTGEEKGLKGSEYYSNHPIFPLESTVANLNTDMIGRIDPKHEGDSNYIYLIGTDMLSTDLHKISEQVNKTYSKLDFDYKYNSIDDPEQFYYRSDHYNFAKHNIPVIFYFNGTHADYHKSTDTVDKIIFPKVEKITRLIFYTAWELANRKDRIEVDVIDPAGSNER